ncbi:calcitonin gene-related peptide isoform X2 [Pristis pectinata]|uniref:calcitonin gene-related peptide isoform X2 n=1 Tax=Pristis pectinata TaxID=685728 RepID=UPI00223CC5E8|nr:calcitonin gene-related peptide isoform X2 [Pristis pectinata]
MHAARIRIITCFFAFNSHLGTVGTVPAQVKEVCSVSLKVSPNIFLLVCSSAFKVMHYLKLSTVLLVVSVSLSSLDGLQAVPSRYSVVPSDPGTELSEWDSWQIPGLRKRSPTGWSAAFPAQELLKAKSFRVKKRKCNTATCVTQRLVDFLSRSNTNLGAFYTPTNVGSNTYGKRDSMGLYSREFLSYLQR